LTVLARALLDGAAEGGELPLDYLLSVMRDVKRDVQTRVDAAKAAAPFCHARLATTTLKGDADSGGPIQVIIQRFADPIPDDQADPSWRGRS
jgi:hypothetical protein